MIYFNETFLFDWFKKFDILTLDTLKKMYDHVKTVNVQVISIWASHV